MYLQLWQEESVLRKVQDWSFYRLQLERYLEVWFSFLLKIKKRIVSLGKSGEAFYRIKNL